ncbi:MAG: CHASE2 domain-containing protein [Pseudomonadota bacterium]
MHIDAEETKRAIMKAEQAVALMDGKLQMKLKPEYRRSLVNAILSSGAQDDLVFHRRTVRLTQRIWSLSGWFARAALFWRRIRKDAIVDELETLQVLQTRIRRSGAPRLAIAMMIGLVCGAIEFGLPAELQLQVARDKVRPIKASGDIVVVAQDRKSEAVLGRQPWPRRHDAVLLDKLREMGARRIVFQNAFSVPTNDIDDHKFAAALERARGKVWLSAQFEQDHLTRHRDPVLPLDLFQTRSEQAHTTIWLNAFGHVNNVRFSETIGDRNYPSSAAILASGTLGRGDLRLDTAIQYAAIPTIPVVDILGSKISPAAIAGKSVIVANTATSGWEHSRILGQGLAPNVYAIAIAAETIKNGAARELGWLPALLAALCVGLACVLHNSPRKRTGIVVGGIAALLFLMLVADRLGLHFEMVPALLVLSIFGIRDSMKAQIIMAQTSNAVSGLPSVQALTFSNGYKKCAVGALKVERYAANTLLLSDEQQREFIRSIASRINIVCPLSIVHQGDDGLFVWLINPADELNLAAISAQLQALFRLPVGVIGQLVDVGIATGFGSDMSEPFAARLAVAIDRARVSIFVTLRSVQ